MAKQHFYSCVPARMSLFAKTDGYDTFACSQGISREQIETELAAVYMNQPTKEDVTRIRTVGMPPVYCQFVTGSRQLVQSSIRFIPSDYTGERSAYLVHSLLLTPEEKKAHLDSPTAALLDPAVFHTEITDFDLVSPDAKPDDCYPETPVPVKEAKSTAAFPEIYDTGMLKRLIYTMVGVACGKIKALYLSLPSPMERFSEDCLDFINSIMQIFPYHLREYLPFITYVSDPAKYTAFKIKCLPEDAPAVPTSRGITLKMGAKDFAGVNDQNIAVHADVVDFFYRLLTADELRREFIDFCEYAVSQDPSLEKPSFKNLGDLIFLFRYLSGFFDEKTVLPNDDTVYNFVSVYDKNRGSVRKDYRVRALQWLRRYPESHTAIPKNVFRKVVLMYPTEPEESRRTVMDVVLELIHTDVMRDKLFQFLREQYDGESPESRSEIMQNICRVYYGGFLQEPILNFLTERFPGEPEEIRRLILEKLFLTVRTPKAQGAVLNFVDRFYDDFREEEKQAFYDLYAEMLPEADDLSRAMTDVVDAHIEEDRKPTVASMLLAAVEADEKSAQPKLCSVLVTRCGFAERVLAEKVFTVWYDRNRADAFLAQTAKKTLAEQMDTVREIWSAAGKLTPEAAKTVADALIPGLKQSVRASVFDWIDAVDRLDETERQIPSAADCCRRIRQEALIPAVLAGIPTVFDRKRYPDGVARITALAQERPYLEQDPAFGCVAAYNRTVQALQGENPEEAFVSACLIEEPVRRGAADRLFRDLPRDLADEKACFFAYVTEKYWETGTPGVADAVAAVRELRVKNGPAPDPKNAKDAAWEADAALTAFVLEACATLYASAIPDEVRQLLVAPESEWAQTITAFLTKHERRGRKWLGDQLPGLAAEEPYKTAVQEVLDRHTASLGLLQKLFH